MLCRVLEQEYHCFEICARIGYRVDMSKWSDEQARRIGKAIKALRGDRTGQWLADRTAELGHPISRTTISELEGDEGRRKHVTTAELAILAAALNVPPIVLLYPGPDYGEYIDVLPGRPVRKIDAVQWFSGIANHPFTNAQGAERAHVHTEYGASTRELFLWRELLAVQRRISSIVVPAQRVKGEVVPGELTDTQRALRDDLYDQEYRLKLQLGLVSIDDDPRPAHGG